MQALSHVHLQCTASWETQTLATAVVDDLMHCRVVGKFNILIVFIPFCAGPPRGKPGGWSLLQGTRRCGSPFQPSQLRRVTEGGSLSPKQTGQVQFPKYPPGGTKHLSKRK